MSVLTADCIKVIKGHEQLVLIAHLAQFWTTFGLVIHSQT